MSETTDLKPRNRYLRSLNELKQTPEFEEFLHREFPVGASEFPEGVSRRRWMKLMGASIALGTVSSAGCRYAEETIAPFVIRPDGRLPGEQHFTATNIEWAGRVYNLLVTGIDGRPIKVEGNSQHPGCDGGSDAFVQGSILHLYDPDRQDGVTSRASGLRNLDGDSWEDFVSEGANKIGLAGFGGVRAKFGGNGGAGFGILMPPSQSPTLVRLLSELKEKYPGVVIGRYDSVTGGVNEAAAELALGKAATPVLDLSAAQVICCLDADILGPGPGGMANHRSFADGREPISGKMNRLYSIESNYSTTGMAADTRYALQPSQMPAFIAALEKQVDAIIAGESHDHPSDNKKAFDELEPDQRVRVLLDVLAHELVDSRGNCVVAVGEHLGVDAVVAGIRLNQKLGGLNKTIRFVEPVDAGLETVALGEFVSLLNSGDLKSVMVLGGNPVYGAPGDVSVAEALGKAQSSVYVGDYDDETAIACQWVVPLAHPFESWGDCQGENGYYGVTQPQILPLLGGRTSIEVVAWLLGDDDASGEAIVRKTADAVLGASLSNRQWRQLLHDGYSEEMKAEPVAVEFSGPTGPLSGQTVVAASEYESDGIDVVIIPADGIYDGRFANNGWLQELPQTMSKLTWDNAALMSPATARKLGTQQEGVVTLGEGDTSVDLPVFELPGHAPGAITVAMGYGRKRAGAVGGSEDHGANYVGVDVAPLQTESSLRMATAVPIRARNATYELATTQDHFAIDELGLGETADRAQRLIREVTLEKLHADPEFVKHMGVHKPEGVDSLWVEPQNEFKEDQYERPQWGMSIDLNKCTGCNGCVVACQAENNVPIVGKEQVGNGREMHWIRVDRYFSGDLENPEDAPLVVQQPLTCQHCETAPCEQVCPVAATVHTEEGINAMAYNRCIGTRYCANNCPFKVRRFNYFNYNEGIGTGYGLESFPNKVEQANRKLQQLVLNPEVSVRGRGVMEKCTFCIQRVEKGKIEARKATAETDSAPVIADGAIQTACQQACSAGAIEFGNLKDPESKVSKAHADQRSYYMLDQLNVKPRTAYLARVRNPHLRLMTKAQHEQLSAKAHHGHGDDHSEAEGGNGEQGAHQEESAKLPIVSADRLA